MVTSRLAKAVAAAAIALTASSALVACGSSKDPNTIVIGTTDAQKKQWHTFEEELKKAGIKAEIKSFNDYNIPNRALSDGQIDINNFQHLKFLAAYNVGNNDTLTPVGATEIVPLGMYYKDHSSIEDVKKAGKVAIPQDSTNQGRAINVLVQAGLVSLKNKNLLNPTPADIDQAASSVTVTPIDAAQTVTAYQDGSPAIVNNSFLNSAKIDPNGAIYKDDPTTTEAQPYINAFVTTKENKDREEFKRLVEIWHSKPVQDAIAEDSQGTSVAVKMDGPELEKILADIEAKTRAEGN